MASLTIHEMPAEERPREKLAAKGAAALSDSELIAILLRTGLPGANAVDVARNLLAKYQSLGGLSRCTVEELSAIKGVGPAKAVQLAAAFGLGARLARETLSRQKIDSPDLVYELLGPEMRALHTESLRVVLLNTRYQLLRIHEVSIGSLNESIAHPREIFRPALIYSALRGHRGAQPSLRRSEPERRGSPAHAAARGSGAAFANHVARPHHHRLAGRAADSVFLV